MRKQLRTGVTAFLAVGSVVALAACGSSSSPPASGGTTGASGTSSGGAVKQGGTITIASGTAPLSADQGLDFTTQGNELYSVINTPLLTFRRGVQGVAGAQILPGLAEALPTVSNGGKTLTFKLRPGLKYSNGVAIKASDVKYALERDIKIPWQAASFISAFVVGGTDYAKGKAKSISGVVTDDSTGTIKVTTVMPFAPMVDIFALPGTAPVPQNTPMKNLASTGTIGDGPYKWGTISAGHTYTLVKNPNFHGVPTVPPGYADKIVYNVNDNVLANAESVLQNNQDVFDPGDTLPSSIVGQVKTQAADRFQAVPTNSTFYFFMAVNQKPFNNIYARQAVLAALDLRALSRLDSGFLVEDCHLIPFGIVGHSNPANCPFHNPDAPPNMPLADSLMKKSGMIGQPVTVWGEERSPRKQYVDYYASVLNKLGFKATEKIINSGVYFTTIGAPTTKPQTGFGDWVQDFPNPWDFMQLFTSTAGSSLNYGYVNDPHYDSTVNELVKSAPEKVQSQWSGLDSYAVHQGYYAAYGHEAFPKFYSDRLNFQKGVLSVEYSTDLTSLALK
jgi:peptide/nickel transport system substrate-binding protein